MSVIDRIKIINEYAKVSARQFCIEVGIANGYLDKVKDVGTEKLKKILNRYPEISPEWLLTGQGPMLRDEADKSIHLTATSGNNNSVQIGYRDYSHNKQIRHNTTSHGTEADMAKILSDMKSELEKKDRIIEKLIAQNEKLINKLTGG